MTLYVDFTTCPLCDAGPLVERPHDLKTAHQGHRYRVTGLRHSTCAQCEAYLTTPTQSRHNKRRVIAARDSVVAAMARAGA